MVIVEESRTIIAKSVIASSSTDIQREDTQLKFKESCLKMYVNGLGFRAIERVSGVNRNTIIRWVKATADRLPNAPSVEEIPEITEIDELQTFVGKKKKKKNGCGQS